MAKHNKVSTTMTDGGIGKRDMARAVQSRPAVAVEFPCEGETVARPFYTIKIAAEASADGVQVSIDKGEWLPCREALGSWWFDWSGFEHGQHELSARTNIGDGLMVSSAPRHFRAE